MPIECPARVGKYTLLRHLSAGGMADLYEARLLGIEDFRRSIAIKIVRKPPGLSDTEADEFVNMFVDEARVCGQLNHANIAQVYELGKIDSLPYMAMELVEGHSLSQIARRARSREVALPLAFTAFIVSRTATGLDYAHRRNALDGEPLNIVHRDVSPDNVLVSYEGEVKVIDFGVAHAKQRRRKTDDGGLRGKLPYMAPEQARQEPVDARADIFGLGAVLYELVAGRRLYLSSGMELFIAARDGLLPDFGRTLSGCSPELRAIIERCLALDKDERFATAAEVAKALEPFTLRERTIFGADDAARVVAEHFPDQPNRRRAEASAMPAELSSTMGTQVLKTFDSEFYKRATQSMAPVDPVRATQQGTLASRPAAAQEGGAPRGLAARTTRLVRALRPRSGRAAFAVLALAALAAGALAAAWQWRDARAVDSAAEVGAQRGYVVFDARLDGKVSISIDGGRWRKLPREPLALPLGAHRVRYRHRSPSGKVQRGAQTVTLTARHRAEAPLRFNFQ